MISGFHNIVCDRGEDAGGVLIFLVPRLSLGPAARETS